MQRQRRIDVNQKLQLEEPSYSGKKCDYLYKDKPKSSHFLFREVWGGWDVNGME